MDSDEKDAFWKTQMSGVHLDKNASPCNLLRLVGNIFQFEVIRLNEAIVERRERRRMVC